MYSTFGLLSQPKKQPNSIYKMVGVRWKAHPNLPISVRSLIEHPPSWAFSLLLLLLPLPPAVIFRCQVLVGGGVHYPDPYSNNDSSPPTSASETSNSDWQRHRKDLHRKNDQGYDILCGAYPPRVNIYFVMCTNCSSQPGFFSYDYPWAHKRVQFATSNISSCGKAVRRRPCYWLEFDRKYYWPGHS